MRKLLVLVVLLESQHAAGSAPAAAAAAVLQGSQHSNSLQVAVRLWQQQHQQLLRQGQRAKLMTRRL
jgi:hypothetical protein